MRAHKEPVLLYLLGLQPTPATLFVCTQEPAASCSPGTVFTKISRVCLQEATDGPVVDAFYSHFRRVTFEDEELLVESTADQSKLGVHHEGGQ